MRIPKLGPATTVPLAAALLLAVSARVRRFARACAVLSALGLSASLTVGQTQFAELGKQSLPKDSDPSVAVALGDVDGDRDLDLVFGNGGQNRLYLNDGKGTFTDASASRLPRDSDASGAVALGDVDGDRDLDLVFGNGEVLGQQNRLYLNDGKGTFTDVTASRLPKLIGSTRAVALGDVDGDRDLDLVLGNGDYSGQQNGLYLNDGKGTFTDVTASRLPKDGDWSGAVALGDVDGDGDLDMVFGNGWGGFLQTNRQQNRLYLNSGGGTFTDATASHLPKFFDGSGAVALGDVDGDHDLDLVFGNDLQNKLYLNDGEGTFTDATASRLPKDRDWVTSVALGDVDGDRDLDLVFGNPGQNRLYLNDGKGTFTDATASRLPKDGDPSYAVALGDVDGDRDLDLVFGTLRGQNRLYLNLDRHVDAPTPAMVGRKYDLDFYARPGYASLTQFAVPFVNLAPAVRPIKVPPLGSFGLSLVGLVSLSPVTVPAPAGKARVQMQIPPNPLLAGQTLHVQALTIHRLAPLEAHFTNVIADRITK